MSQRREKDYKYALRWQTMMEDKLLEEAVAHVGEAVGDSVEKVIGDRPWVFSLWRFSLYAVPLGFCFYLLNGVYSWISFIQR
jgi:hypothetical protein